jgi:hypothetical protein
VETASMDVAVKIVNDWAKLHQVAVESSSSSRKTAARAGKPGEGARTDTTDKTDKIDKSEAAKTGDVGTERITMVLTSAELSELLLRLNGTRETFAKLDSAPPAVQGYVSAVMSKPAMLYSVADLDEAGAGAQKPEAEKAADNAKKAKDAAASQPKNAQVYKPGVEVGQSVRTTIIFREAKKK